MPPKAGAAPQRYAGGLRPFSALAGAPVVRTALLPRSLPEGIGGYLRRAQQSALGSAIATIGLTIPIVSVTALMLGQRITLGLAPEETALLVLTLFISTVNLATGRTTILQGSVHLIIFGVFIFLAAVPYN